MEWLASAQGGLLFANLVDFDTLYGHRGDVAGFERALRQFDDALPAMRAALREDDLLFITADHGNCDHMLEPDGSPNTAHSLNPVPLIVTAEGVTLREHGILADVAPTVLQLLGIPQPAPMTGHSLIA